jgi:hypothetical protein
MKKFTIILTVLIAMTINANAQWQQTNCLHNGRTNCFAISGNDIFTGIENDGIYLSTDEGATWALVNSGLTNTSVRSMAISGANIFACTAGSGLFLSTNNGANWTAINNGLTNTDVRAILAMSPYVTIGTNGGGVFTSSNNGSNWNADTSANHSGLTNLNIVTLGMIGYIPYAGTSSGVFKFDYAGTNTWLIENNGLTNLDVYTLFGNGTDLYAGTQGGGVFKTTNNGTNWSAINTGLTFNYITSFAVSGTNIFAGTNGGGIFLSTNNGASWTAINTGLTALDIYSLGVSGAYLYAGTNADGVWKRSLSEITGVNEINANKNVNIYPNPASNLITLNFDRTNNQKITLNFYNVMGELVKTELLKQNQQQVNICDLNNGIYIVEINTNNWSEKHPLIIQR